jgi:hypothetical protein
LLNAIQNNFKKLFARAAFFLGGGSSHATDCANLHRLGTTDLFRSVFQFLAPGYSKQIICEKKSARIREICGIEGNLILESSNATVPIAIEITNSHRSGTADLFKPIFNL